MHVAFILYVESLLEIFVSVIVYMQGRPELIFAFLDFYYNCVYEF